MWCGYVKEAPSFSAGIITVFSSRSPKDSNEWFRKSICHTKFCTSQSAICLVIYLIATYLSDSVTLTFGIFYIIVIVTYHSLMHHQLFHLWASHCYNYTSDEQATCASQVQVYFGLLGMTCPWPHSWPLVTVTHINDEHHVIAFRPINGAARCWSYDKYSEYTIK